jgi:tRNA dimethylallyltransferase
MAKDPKAGRQIHPNNVKKVIRALERWKTEGEIKPFRDNLRPTKDYKVLMIGLKRNRDQLYHRIEKRVDGFIQAGLVEEVEKLLGRGLSPKDISMKGIGYKEIIPFLEGKVSLEEAREEIKKNTRNLAKRQMTWFRSYSDVKWFDLSEIDHPVEEMVQWWKNR